jgi:hypothetical protein
MSNLKDDALHPPPVPHHRYNLAFRGDINELREYFEQVAAWGIDSIVRVTFRRGSSTAFMLLSLDIIGGDPKSVIELFVRDKAVWGNIKLRSVRAK